MILKNLIIAIAVFIGLTTTAFARDYNEGKIYGTIEQVDVQKRILDVKGDDGKTYQFSYNPATDVEFKHKYWFDFDGSVEELKKGDWIEMEYDMSSPTFFVAKDIEVYRK